MATQLSKKRKFVADGVFFAELNEVLTRELAEDGYSGVEVRVTPMQLRSSSGPPVPKTFLNDPCTNAGRGSNLTEDGHVECDASIMEGSSGTFGAVGAVPGVKTAIKIVALLVKEQMSGSSLLGRIPPMFLASEGARAWAKSKGTNVSGTIEDTKKWLVTRKQCLKMPNREFLQANRHLVVNRLIMHQDHGYRRSYMYR